MSSGMWMAGFVVLAGDALTLISAGHPHLEALAVLLLAVTFSAVAPFVMSLRFSIKQRSEGLGVPGLDGSHGVVALLEMFGGILAFLTLAVHTTELPQSEAVAVEFETLCVSAGAEELPFWSRFEVGVAAVLAVAVVELGEVDRLQIWWSVLVACRWIAFISGH